MRGVGVTSAWLNGQQHWAGDSLLLGHLQGKTRRSEPQELVNGPPRFPHKPPSHHGSLLAEQRANILVGAGVAEGARCCGWPAG